MVNLAPIMEESIAREKRLDKKVNHPRPRWGKTKKDKANNQAGRNYANKQARAAWQHDNKATAANFPYAHCNGKRNRSIWTGKGNRQVINTIRK